MGTERGWDFMAAETLSRRDRDRQTRRANRPTGDRGASEIFTEIAAFSRTVVFGTAEMAGGISAVAVVSAKMVRLLIFKLCLVMTAISAQGQYWRLTEYYANPTCAGSPVPNYLKYEYRASSLACANVSCAVGVSTNGATSSRSACLGAAFNPMQAQIAGPVPGRLIVAGGAQTDCNLNITHPTVGSINIWHYPADGNTCYQVGTEGTSAAWHRYADCSKSVTDEFRIQVSPRESECSSVAAVYTGIPDISNRLTCQIGVAYAISCVSTGTSTGTGSTSAASTSTTTTTGAAGDAISGACGATAPAELVLLLLLVAAVVAVTDVGNSDGGGGGGGSRGGGVGSVLVW